jgi:hypothetical protein
MYPEEDAPREQPDPPRRAPHGQEDLRGLPFPLGDWGEPAERLEELYRWAEEGALHTVDWYLTDRIWKRRGARGLRLSAALLATVGGVLPLVGLASSEDAVARWGYVALLLAVLCVALDRCFGLTSGWMRDVATAQAVQRRLETLRFDWASESVREVLGPTEGTSAEAAERCLGVLRRFCEDVGDLVRVETADWMVDFGADSGPLRTQSVVPCGTRTEGAPGWRFHVLPGGRPNMPRQRPPDGPGAR